MKFIICVIIVQILSKTKVTAQEGPGKVTAHPGQDVELLCTVTEDSTALTEGWLVNNMGPYKINAIHHGILSGHNASMDGGNLMVQNITTNDNRSGSEYICVIIPAEGSVTIADIIYWSDPTFLYVSDGRNQVPRCSVTSVSGKVSQNRKGTKLKFTAHGVLLGHITYQCRLDNRKIIKDCKSPTIWRNLKKGKHTVAVKASCVDNEGNKLSTVKRNFRFQVR